jgi:hypothetical protein
MGLVGHTCNTSTKETEAGQLIEACLRYIQILYLKKTKTQRLTVRLLQHIKEELKL